MATVYGSVREYVESEEEWSLYLERLVRTSHWPGRFCRDTSRSGKVCIGGRFSGGSRCWRASSDVRSSMATGYGTHK